MAEEVARESEGPQASVASSLTWRSPKHARQRRVHQQPSEQRAWQQDGEEIHQADEDRMRLEDYRPHQSLKKFRTLCAKSAPVS